MATLATNKITRLTLDAQPQVARIVLKNPPLNVIDLAMMEELSQALGEIEARSDVSVVILSGQGKAFSAGVDVAAHTPDKVGAMLRVTIASVQGHCLGGGAELAMVCDMVYTDDSAHWGFPEIKLGCYPPVACTALAALVGQKRAAELILTGRVITGRQAAEIGLANRSTPVAELAGAVDECVADLLRLSPRALAVTKKAVYAWDAMHFDKGLARAEKIYLEELMKTRDAQEGIQAFLEKRGPKWGGG